MSLARLGYGEVCTAYTGRDKMALGSVIMSISLLIMCMVAVWMWDSSRDRMKRELREELSGESGNVKPIPPRYIVANPAPKEEPLPKLPIKPLFPWPIRLLLWIMAIGAGLTVAIFVLIICVALITG